jgi:hypothetical protein
VNGTVFASKDSLKVHARQRNRVLAGFDPDTLAPVSADAAERRRLIAARMARRGRINAAVSELRAVGVECALVFPFAALATVAWFAINIP